MICLLVCLDCLVCLVCLVCRPGLSCSAAEVVKAIVDGSDVAATLTVADFLFREFDRAEFAAVAELLRGWRAEGL